MDKEIIRNLEDLKNNRILKGEREVLIKKAFSISLAYLRIKHAENELFSIPEVTPEDIAIDATAYLFSKNRENRLRIFEEMNGHSERIFTDGEANYYFTRVVKIATDKILKFEGLKWGTVNGYLDMNYLYVKT